MIISILIGALYGSALGVIIGRFVKNLRGNNE